MRTVIAFPSFMVACGFPPTVELTAAEHKACSRLHLGGMDGLQAKSISRVTVRNLIAKGILGHSGPTALGRKVAESCAEMDHATIVNS